MAPAAAMARARLRRARGIAAGAIAPAGPDFEAAGPDFEAAGPDSEAAGPDFSEAAGPDFSEAAGPDFSEGVGPDFSETAGPDFSEAAGPDFSEGVGPDFSEGVPGPDSLFLILVVVGLISPNTRNPGFLNFPGGFKAREVSQRLPRPCGIDSG